MGVPGKTPVVTDIQGGFSIPLVKKPYDLAVVISDAVYLFVGLTRPNPTLPTDGTRPPTKSARISGRLSGRLRNHFAIVTFGSAQSQGTSWTDLQGAYSMESRDGYAMTWVGSDSITGTLHALQWPEDGFSRPLPDYSYGRLDKVSVSNGQTLSGRDFALNTVNSNTLSGSIILPSGFRLGSKSMGVLFDANSFYIVQQQFGNSSTSFSYATPAIDGASCFIHGFASSDQGYVEFIRPGLPTAQSGVSIQIPQINASLVSPADRASEIGAGSTFSWTDPPALTQPAVHQLRLYDFGRSAGPSYCITTATNSAQLPDLADFGVSPQRSATYAWEVDTFADFSSVDSATAPDGLAPLFNARARGRLTKDLAVGHSAQRTFTTPY